jgi:predicted RNA binding protein YcfA (HicA-like mRNA interferase family)
MEISEGGSHTKVRLGGRTTVVGRHPGDMPPGTFRKVLKDVGITPGDLED